MSTSFGRLVLKKQMPWRDFPRRERMSIVVCLSDTFSYFKLRVLVFHKFFVQDDDSLKKENEGERNERCLVNDFSEPSLPSPRQTINDRFFLKDIRKNNLNET
jgi:hypothetical protein